MPDFANAVVQTPLREGGRKLGQPETVDEMVWDRVRRVYARRLAEVLWAAPLPHSRRGSGQERVSTNG